MVKSVGIMYPAQRADAVNYARHAAELLQREGIRVLCESEETERMHGLEPMSDACPPEAILSLGGDGTLLRAVKYAIGPDVPVLGVNLGHMGFLTETEPEALERVVKALAAGSYTIDQRWMLSAALRGAGTWPAMNDAVITRAGNARLLTMKVFVDGEEAGHYMADGLVVCTPTGSTGYSLSAGGPIVSPSVHCMVITPVCAHSLVSRPLIVHGGARIRVELQDDVEMTAMLQADGRNCSVLHGRDVIEVSRLAQQAKLIRLQEPHFFGLVRRKLQEWS